MVERTFCLSWVCVWLTLATSTAAAEIVAPRDPLLDVRTPAEWEHLLAAPTVDGATGLFHVLSARSAPPRSVRVGVHFEGFYASPFFFQGLERDQNLKLDHRIAIVAGGPQAFFLDKC